MRRSIFGFTALLVAFSLAGGCCNNPGVFAKASQAMGMVQAFYDPLVGQFMEDRTNDQLKAAVVAADTALMLAGVMQDSFCPSSGEVQQLDLQAQEAQKMAQQAGVKQ